MSESFSPDFVGARLALLGGKSDQRYVCALSGGADSLSLAHALSQIKARVRLVHVNHHLQSDSDRWAEALSRFAQNLQLEFASLDVFPDGSANLEALAREARYGALAENLCADEILLTGHHQDDQALTLLLQLLRGAGPAGLAAMPMMATLATYQHWRPLLDVAASELRHYAIAQQLPVIEDPSNGDQRFARNYLRANVVPLLEARWPAYARTLARSAAHCAQADALLGELAGIDAPDYAGAHGVDLSCAAIETDARAENVLRFMLRQHGSTPPPAARLREFVRQVRRSATDSEPRLELGHTTLRSYERHVFEVVEAPRLAATADTDFELAASRPLRLPFPTGTVVWQPASDSRSLRVRFRRGGERFGQSPSRRLKHFFQQRRVLPWYRAAVPLLFDRERIVAIGDLWQDPALCGTIEWRPDVPVTL